MSARHRWLAVALVVAGAACADIASPLRDNFYEWRLITPAASGTGVDSLSFHWPRNRLPVRVWVEDAASLPVNVPIAIATWRGAFLYGEFDATIVGDSSAADVIVRAGGAPGVEFSRRAVRLHSALAPQCAGATDLDISEDHTQLRLPVRMYIDPRSDPNAADLPACLALTTIHELGHALGIWEHSAQSTDIMFADPVAGVPSDRDLGTAEVLYHLPPNVEPIGP